MAEVVILGAGVMGAAMAFPAAAMGHRVALVGTHLDEAIVTAIAGTGHHPGLRLELPSTVTAHRWTEFETVMARVPDLLILGVSSAGVGWGVDRIADCGGRACPILMVTKGLAPAAEGIEILPAVVERALRARRGTEQEVMAIGGPCIAGELAAGRDTCVVIAGRRATLVEQTIAALKADFYHPQPSDDLAGVEACAALKNFYALAVGWANGRLERDGKGPNGALMHNAAAGLFTQALAEMEVLAEALGGRRETVAGLAGAGDLYVTCQAGRNSRMGRLFGLGYTYHDAKQDHMPDDTVEGAELAIALDPTIGRMIGSGRLPERRLPLMRAILDVVCRNAAPAFELELRQTDGLSRRRHP